jgi:OOP family OmpA-OmpF porin
MRSRVTAAIAWTIVMTSGVGHAQSRSGFAVGRFEPAERGSPYFVMDALDFRERRHPALGATLDYAHKPLAVEDATGVERFALVRHQAMVHVGGSLAIGGRLRFGLDLPFAAYQDGEPGTAGGATLKAATDPAMADVRLAVDVRLFGRKGDPFVLAAGARSWLPTGLRSQFTGDGALRIGPQLLASGDVGPLGWAARLALTYRARDDAYAGASLGSEISGGVATGVRTARSRLFIGPELWASSALSNVFGARETPVNVLFGAHYDVGPIRLGAGAGAGLFQGLGSPRLRVLASIEWAPADEHAPADRDRDGILDPDDACPDEAGVRDSDETANGCPPPPPIPREDLDGDEISDTDDACPSVRGERTSDPMTNGCPPSSAPRPLAVVTKSEIRIGERIGFATDSARLLLDSDPVLSAVETILREHPEILRIRIEGHTDTVGDPAYNEELSARRAAAVKAWLEQHGVDARRLESVGLGSRQPVDTNDTETGRANNRRVVFTIVERDPARR